MSSHTDRSFHTRERALLTTTRALYGTIDKTVSFLPMALRHGTRTIFSWVRAKEQNYCSTSVQECQMEPLRGAAFIPVDKIQGPFAACSKHCSKRECIIHITDICGVQNCYDSVR